MLSRYLLKSTWAQSSCHHCCVNVDWFRSSMRAGTTRGRGVPSVSKVQWKIEFITKREEHWNFGKISAQATTNKIEYTVTCYKHLRKWHPSTWTHILGKVHPVRTCLQLVSMLFLARHSGKQGAALHINTSLSQVRSTLYCTVHKPCTWTAPAPAPLPVPVTPPVQPQFLACRLSD